LTEFGIVCEVAFIEPGELLLDLILIDISRSIVASGVTETEVAEFVAESADLLGLDDALDAACETAAGWNVQNGLPEEDPYADPGTNPSIPEGAYNFQLRAAPGHVASVDCDF
jgi:hypothetical protein